MSAGFKVWNLLQHDVVNAHPHVASATIAAGVLLVGSIAYRASLSKTKFADAPDEALVPSEKFGIKNIFELPGEFVQGIAKDIIGPHYGDYLPMMMFIFMWTLLNNLLGSVPGFGSTTDNLNSTMSMAIFVFVYYNYVGFKKRGFGYLEDYTGHLKGVLLLTLGVVMFPIELISNLVRPMTLGIRLRSNIFADHTVYGIINDLFSKLSVFLQESLGVVGTIIGHVIASLGPTPIFILGLIVAFIQAFVFTMLTIIYVGMATAQHDDH